MLSRWSRLILPALLALLLVGTASAQTDLPKLPQAVNDVADVLSPAQEIEMATRINQVQAASEGRLERLFVLVVPTMSGHQNSEEFGKALFLANGLNRRDVVLFLSFEPRAIDITNGEDVESYFASPAPNCVGDWGNYALDKIIPHLQADEPDFHQGLLAGINEISNLLTQPAANCSVPASPPAPAPAAAIPAQTGSINWELIWCIIIGILLLIIIGFLVVYIDTENPGGDGYYGGTGGTYTPSRRRGGYSWPSGGFGGYKSPSGGFGGGGSTSRSSFGGFGGGGSTSRSSFRSSSSSSRSSSPSSRGKSW